MKYPRIISEVRLTYDTQDYERLTSIAEDEGVQVIPKSSGGLPLCRDSALFYARRREEDPVMQQRYREAAMHAMYAGGAVVVLLGSEGQLARMDDQYFQMPDLQA